MVRPLRILIEGLDGVGKTTLCSELVKIWPSPHVQIVAFPSQLSAPGRLIREVFNGTVRVAKSAMMYLMVADAVDCESAIARHLTDGVTVICDRHSVVSAFVYQREDHPLEDVAAVIRAARFTLPHLIAYVDAPPAVALARRAKRGLARNTLYEPSPKELDRLERQRLFYLERIGELERSGVRTLTLNGVWPSADLAAIVLAAAEGLA